MASRISRLICAGVALLASLPSSSALVAAQQGPSIQVAGRERTSLNDNWRFQRSEKNPDGLLYDNRPDTGYLNGTGVQILKRYILPSANNFIKDPADRHTRPEGSPGSNVSYVQQSFDDSAWEQVTLPHDWAIKGPFYEGDPVPVGGGMGRLPVQGIGWYRKQLDLSSSDRNMLHFLDVDGAMSYAMVWLNGQLVGGWPYGYASFRLDLTPYLKFDGKDLLAIRLDNPVESARWYPGGGIYRNVWLTKVNQVHIGQWGTHATTNDVSKESATVSLVVQLDNGSNSSSQVEVVTDIHIFDPTTGQPGQKVSEFPRSVQDLEPQTNSSISQSVTIANPALWGPPPTQKPNLYVAITRLLSKDVTLDTYETRFGIRTFEYDPNQGLIVNGEKIRIQGVNNHHDLGAIGSAFNLRAAERQLEICRDMGVNAIRMSHNPPATELLELTDRLGFLVMDEIFDSWQLKKTANDFFLIFNDWHEPDLRAFLRRDRNHASIFSWSIGNEVGEQYTNETGAAVAQMLSDIVKEEDPTRPVAASMNYAKPYMPFPRTLDLITLNYQGEGVRDAPAYSHLSGITTPPQYANFHAAFPEKMILATESAASLSTRGTYIFPVIDGISAPVNDTSGGNSTSLYVSDYSLYSADFGSSPDKVFTAQDNNSYVAGEFIWSGFDYLGEPTPYYTARSSYFGPIDLAGFPKDRFFLYQSRWRPDLQKAHILPHWTWPDREGLVTPVHVFSAGDEAELFLNGESLGRRKKGDTPDEAYRFRWDDVVYAPGEVSVVTYKDGSEWANATVRTAGPAAKLRASADRDAITADGLDLSFITVDVLDAEGNVVPIGDTVISFAIDGSGDLVATDNGDPTDFTPFPSAERRAFGGKALGIVRAGVVGDFVVTASGEGLESGSIIVKAR